MNLFVLLVFVASCFAADNSGQNPSSSDKDKRLIIGQPPESLHIFLQSYESWQGNNPMFSFGRGLGACADIATCGTDESEVKVSKMKLIEIIIAEYPKSTDKINPFSEFYDTDSLLKELSNYDSRMTLAEFLNVMSKYAKPNLRPTFLIKLRDHAQFSMNLAILLWLADAIRMNPNVRLDPSWLPHLASIYDGALVYFKDEVLIILNQVQRMIDSKLLTQQQAYPLLGLYNGLKCFCNDNLIIGKLFDILIKVNLI